MEPTRPLFDPERDELDFGRVVSEAAPIATLLVAFGLVGAIVGLVAVALANTPFSVVLYFVAWLVVAVGGFVTLLYVVARAIQLSDRDDPPGDGEPASNESESGPDD